MIFLSHTIYGIISLSDQAFIENVEVEKKNTDQPFMLRKKYSRHRKKCEQFSTVDHIQFQSVISSVITRTVLQPSERLSPIGIMGAQSIEGE